MFGKVTTDRDDASVIRHVQKGCLNSHKHSTYIDVHCPVKSIQRQIVNRRNIKHTGIIDEDIKPAKNTGSFINRGRNRRFILIICLKGDGPSAICFNPGDDLVGFLRRVGIGNGNLRAFCRKALGDCGTDATAPACYEGDLSERFCIGKSFM